ncbi:hypothetical protein Dimus_009315 [Dionaea muscipula]
MRKASWSDKSNDTMVDLDESGETAAVISLLETLTSKLDLSDSSSSEDPGSASALRVIQPNAASGLPLNADVVRSRAAALKSRFLRTLIPEFRAVREEARISCEVHYPKSNTDVVLQSSMV